MPQESCVHKTVLVLGIFELIFGLGVIACGVANIILHSYYYVIGHGIWGGAFMVLTALFAIFAGLKKSRCLHITHMVFAILAVVLVLPPVEGLFRFEATYDGSYIVYSDYYGQNMDSSTNNYWKTYGSEMAALSLCGISFVIFIISASFTCCAVCACCGANRNMNNMNENAVYPQNNGNGYPGQQQGYYGNQQQLGYDAQMAQAKNVQKVTYGI